MSETSPSESEEHSLKNEEALADTPEQKSEGPVPVIIPDEAAEQKEPVDEKMETPADQKQISEVRSELPAEIDRSGERTFSPSYTSVPPKTHAAVISSSHIIIQRVSRSSPDHSTFCCLFSLRTGTCVALAAGLVRTKIMIISVLFAIWGGMHIGKSQALYAHDERRKLYSINGILFVFQSLILLMGTTFFLGYGLYYHDPYALVGWLFIAGFCIVVEITQFVIVCIYAGYVAIIFLSLFLFMGYLWYTVYSYCMELVEAWPMDRYTIITCRPRLYTGTLREFPEGGIQ